MAERVLDGSRARCGQSEERPQQVEAWKMVILGFGDREVLDGKKLSGERVFSLAPGAPCNDNVSPADRKGRK